MKALAAIAAVAAIYVAPAASANCAYVRGKMFEEFIAEASSRDEVACLKARRGDTGWDHIRQCRNDWKEGKGLTEAFVEAVNGERDACRQEAANKRAAKLRYLENIRAMGK